MLYLSPNDFEDVTNWQTLISDIEGVLSIVAPCILEAELTDKEQQSLKWLIRRAVRRDQIAHSQRQVRRDGPFQIDTGYAHIESPPDQFFTDWEIRQLHALCGIPDTGGSVVPLGRFPKPRSHLRLFDRWDR